MPALLLLGLSAACGHTAVSGNGLPALPAPDSLAGREPSPRIVETDANTYSVYRTVLQDLLAGQIGSAVLSSRTRWPSEMVSQLKRSEPDVEGWLCGRLPGLSRPLAVAFLRNDRVRKEAELLDRFKPLGVAVAGLSERGRAWSALRRRFPHADAFLEFSRVAFTNAGTDALVYVEFTTGDLNGRGALVWVKRTGSHWRVHRTTNLWTS